SEYLDTIIRNGNALTKIIDDILDLAKVEAGKLEVEIVPVSLHDLSAETIDLFREKIQDKEIYLKLDIAPDVPRSISSDPTRLRQILVNLIGNAVKFTDTGGVTVRIRATPIIENKARIVIDVEDTGIGLADNQRDRLFTPFSQADNSMTRKFGGTGLGLVLSQRLSHALAGEITISQSKAGAGSTFTLVFEASLPDNAIKSDVKSVDKLIDKSLPLLGLKVLAVDDSPDNLLLVQRLLIKNGATVETARDGDEGAMKALAGNFQVVLMDLQMPKMDGYQAKQALDRSGYQQPVIALTAHAMSDERVKTKAAGFAAHLTKPLNAPDLLATLSLYCGKSQLSS
ncbi:MAG: response regulator, partial [Proteobacteria bacterium]